MNDDNPTPNDPFRENADLIRAIEDAPPRGDIEMPQHVLFKLERARVEALGQSQPATFSDVTRRRSSFLIRHSSLLRLAAVLTVLATITWLLIPGTPPTAHVTITSPGDAISETQPVIAWTTKDKPGQQYDVWILPAEGDHLTAPALFKAEKVTSPVAFASLKPGKGHTDTALTAGTDYRVLVCLADMGRTAGVPVPFKVKPAPAP